MTRKVKYTLTLLIFSQLIVGQSVPLKSVTAKLKAGQSITAEDFGFQAYSLIENGDTINFYTYQKGNTKPQSIYLFLPGSNAENIYTAHKEGTSYWYSSLISFDFSYMPEDYLFIVVAKPGFGFFNNTNQPIPDKYWEKTSLDDRVWRADKTLNYITKNILKNPKKVVVFGYSEGFYVGAKLATANKKITHLGLGGGGAFSDFYDFIVSNLKSSNIDKTNADTVISENAEYLSDLQKVMANPSQKEFIYGYSHKRWASFSEPALYSLVKLQIPMFQIHGSLDDNTPVESAYAVAAEFARLRKNNLTFKVYPNCDHSLIERSADKEVEHWKEMMTSFFEWVSNKATK